MMSSPASGWTIGRPVPAVSLLHHHELHKTGPKGLNPAKAIAEIKKLMVERR